MAAPDQQAQAGGSQEIAKLFQNVGQGLILVTQYVSQVAPQSLPVAEEIMGAYEQLVQAVSQARQGQGAPPQGRPQASGPAPMEAGAAQVRPA